MPGGANLQAGEEIGHEEVVEDLQGDLARQSQVEEGNVRQFIDVADQLVDQCQWLCFQFFRWHLDDRWLLRGGIRRRRRREGSNADGERGVVGRQAGSFVPLRCWRDGRIAVERTFRIDPQAAEIFLGLGRVLFVSLVVFVGVSLEISPYQN